MKSKDLFEAIGGADEELIERCKEKKKVKSTWRKWGIVAASLCIIVAGALLWQQRPSETTESGGITVSEDGVTIPKMQVSLSANSGAKMIPFFIYQGRCYIHYETIYNGGDIASEYLGTATGLIDEWTSKDGYVELAGSVQGDFYSVKGYDPSFILGMRETDGTINTFIANTGITLKYGSELYEDKLHLTGNYTEVQYESHSSWDYSKGEIYKLSDGGSSVITSFIEELNAAEFMPWDVVSAKEGQPAIEEKGLYHLYFKMNNGTTIHLRLYEGGYVRFQGILDIYVKVPDKSFNALLEILK